MTEYRERIDNMVWSHSRVTCYESCPYCFFVKYIVKDDAQYLAESNYYAEIGGYVHSILEKIFNNEISVDDATQYYIDNYESNVLYKTKKNIMQKTYEACADYFASVDFDWLKDFDILGVEKKIETEIKGYKFLAYPFKKDGTTVLQKSKKDFEKYKKQMYLYSKAVYDEYNVFPKWLVWNHFKVQQFAKIPFKKTEYNKSMKWFVDVIHKIEEDDTFDAHVDYFYCTQLCDFRNSCEYAKQNN